MARATEIYSICAIVYCIAVHSRDLLKNGLTAEALAMVRIWPEAGAMFPGAEATALAWPHHGPDICLHPTARLTTKVVLAKRETSTYFLC